jgi:hypothetical protein
MPTSSPATLQAIYIAPHDPFPEVEDFVETTTGQYHLDLRRYSVPMRSALEAYIQDRPTVKAIFMGTRRTDPHCEFLTHFSPTDKDWPQFMRVNPVIDWHYVEIWAVSLRWNEFAWTDIACAGTAADPRRIVHPPSRNTVLQSVPARILLTGWHDKHPA